MSISVKSLLLAPCLAAMPAVAAESSFGLQAHLAVPTGTFADKAHLDGKAGLGLGFNVPIDFGDGQVLRPKVDYLNFSQGNGDARYKTESLIFSVEYNHYFMGEREGAYMITGLGIHSTRRDAARNFDGLLRTSDRSGTGLYYDLGLGYAFNRSFAMELKYVGMRMPAIAYTPLYSDTAFTGNSVVATASFTF